MQEECMTAFGCTICVFKLNFKIFNSQGRHRYEKPVVTVTLLLLTYTKKNGLT